MKTPKTQSRRAQQLVNLRRRLKKRIEDLNNGQNWAVNDRVCKSARANKAEGVQECIIEINYLLKHGQADDQPQRPPP